MSKSCKCAWTEFVKRTFNRMKFSCRFTIELLIDNPVKARRIISNHTLLSFIDTATGGHSLAVEAQFLASLLAFLAEDTAAQRT